MQCYIAKCNLPNKKQTIFCKMQSLKKNSKNRKDVEKYLMKDIDPLITSILEADKKLTEELICAKLGYNDGYIAQCRSREKNSGEPQVTLKFKNQLKTLQNATISPKSIAEPGSLTEALAIIKQQNAFLQKLVESNLAGISRDVNNNAAAIQAEIRGYGKYQILKQSNWDDQEFAKAMAVVDRIYGEELKVDDGQGSHGS
jgi:hypothetical protein